MILNKAIPLNYLKNIRQSSIKIIPPNISALQKASGSTTQESTSLVHELDKEYQIKDIIKLYSKIPKGNYKIEPKTLYQRYHHYYLNSPVPVFHFIFVMFCVGYSLEYFSHLRYHKNAKFH